MQANSFGVVQKRKQIIMFKLRGHFVFRHYFDDKEIFRALADLTTEINTALSSRPLLREIRRRNFWRERASM